jgi:hypothetical protein
MLQREYLILSRRCPYRMTQRALKHVAILNPTAPNDGSGRVA